MSFIRNLFQSEIPENNLCIIITRHGERADLALGPGWRRKIQITGQHDARVSYLTPRADFREWDYDPPLTVKGERQSQSIGRKLLALGYPIDYCYSSPAYRSIQTATNILKSQGRSAVPISIESGLFECPIWYAGAPLTFVPPEHIVRDRHFQINSSYSPIYDDINPEEDEKGYYQRSRLLIDAIVKAHKSEGGTILLSGHAGSIEAVTRGLLHRRARPSLLQSQANKVNYCSFVMLERDASTRQWTVHLPQTVDNPYGGQMSIQTSIPLYSVSSQSLLTTRSAQILHPDVPHAHRDASYRYRGRPRHY